MKHGANHLTGTGLVGILTNVPLLAGYVCYGVNTVLLVMALRQGHLSVLYPIIALTYVWVTILSPMFFVDHLNIFKVTGVGLIVVGVSFIGVGSRS
jgi:multidrug transporter EmrE-like cation transporter